MPRFRALSDGEVDEKSHAEDLVTVADKASEIALTMAVEEIFEDAQVVGEEAVSADRSILKRIGEAGRTVVIDPIDGTWNYANGIATYGVIVAVVEGGETVMGLLYDPMGDDWVVARKGEGAWFGWPDREPKRLSASGFSGKLKDAAGYVGMYLYDKPGQRKIAATLPLFRRTMNLRCSAHEYRMLAQGKADFCLNGMLNAWDHAGGVLIYQEAGGVARLLDGQDYAPTMTEGILVTAASEALWEELAEVWAGLT